MKILLLVTVLFCSYILYSQQNESVLSGKISDEFTGEPLESVNIKLKNSYRGTTSNSLGEFTIRIDNLPATIEFSYVGYDKYYLYLNKEPEDEVHIKLKPRATLLREVIISEHPVQNIMPRKDIHLTDFEFLDNNILAISLFGRKVRNRSLVLFNFDGDTLASLKIRSCYEQFFKDCLDNVHLIGQDTVWQVYYDGAGLSLLYPSPKDKFFMIMQQCVEEFNHKLVFRRTYNFDQAAEFYLVDRKTGKPTGISRYDDSRGNEMFRELFRVNQGNIHLPKIIDDPHLRFEMMMMFDPLVTPLFVLNDTLRIFNFNQHCIEHYDTSNVFLHSLPIDFHKQRSFDNRIIMDEEEEMLYAIFIKNGRYNMAKINHHSGKITGSYPVPDYPFIGKIRIFNGYLYFLYTDDRDFVDFSGYRKLYRMPLAGEQ